jgi:hypothetical protein
MLETPTLDDLLNADVDVMDRDENMGNHMQYMILTEVVTNGTTSSIRVPNAFVSLACLHAGSRNESIKPKKIKVTSTLLPRFLLLKN